MALDKLLAAAVRLTWRRRSWWVLGLLATSGGLLVSLILRGVTQFLATELLLENIDVQNVPEKLSSPESIIAGVTGALVLGLAFWLISAVAEGGLIVAVRRRASGESSSLIGALRAGMGLLGRFVGIDTLLFLPLFLLALALMLVGFAGLTGLVLAATRPGAQLTDLLLVVGVSTAVSVPILLLTVPVGVLILVLRMLAFRAAAVEGLNAVDSVRRAWKLLRRYVLSVAVLALVLWAVRSLLGTPLRLLTMFVTGLGWAMVWTGPDSGADVSGVALAVVGMILALLVWLVNGIMNVFGSAAWTLSYEEWVVETV